MAFLPFAAKFQKPRQSVVLGCVKNLKLLVNMYCTGRSVNNPCGAVTSQIQDLLVCQKLDYLLVALWFPDL